MRADALTPEIAPRLSEFARGAIRFDRHYSGGNASRAGMFSLFYGLPATYWDAFANAVRPPVVMDMFRPTDYQLGAFVSAALYTASGSIERRCARVPNLRLRTYSPYPGDGHSGKDRQLTDEWHEWLDRRDPSRPFFGTSLLQRRGGRRPSEGYASRRCRSRPGRPNSARARPVPDRRALHRLAVRARGRRSRAAEAARSHRGHRHVRSRHGVRRERARASRATARPTASTSCTPRSSVRWPGRPPARVTRRTSHNDVAPTLLTELFGCTNPPSDYASGHEPLLGWRVELAHRRQLQRLRRHRARARDHRPVRAGYEIRDRSYRLVPNPTLPRDALRAAMQEMSRFYR